MILRNRIKDPSVFIRVGSASLVLALVSLRFVPPVPGYRGELLDGIKGFLFGIAIAFLLLGAWMNGRRRGGDDSAPCG